MVSTQTLRGDAQVNDMTFQKFLQLWIKNGGTQRSLAHEIGISEETLCRILHKKQQVGIGTLNKMLGACRGEGSMGEVMGVYRPAIYYATWGAGGEERD